MRLLRAQPRPRLRAVHLLREHARGRGAHRGRAAVPAARPGRGAAGRAARHLPPHAGRGAARHRVLLAGRRRRRRAALVRDHRQAAVRLARPTPWSRRASTACADPRRQPVRRLPGAGGHPHAEAGAGAADPLRVRPRHPGRARQPAGRARATGAASSTACPRRAWCTTWPRWRSSRSRPMPRRDTFAGSADRIDPRRGRVRRRSSPWRRCGPGRTTPLPRRDLEAPPRRRPRVGAARTSTTRPGATVHVPMGWGQRERPRGAVRVVPARRRPRTRARVGGARAAWRLTVGKVDSAYEVFAGGVRLGGVGGLPPSPRVEYDRHRTYAGPAGRRRRRRAASCSPSAPGTRRRPTPACPPSSRARS